MSKGIGRQIQMGIAKETSRGTSPSTADIWLPFTEVTLDDKDEKALDEQSYGVMEDSTDQKIVSQYAELAAKFNIGDQSFPLVLFAALGALSTASNADGSGTIKDHTISVGQSSQKQSLSLYLDDPLAGADYKHALGVVETLDIMFEDGKFINAALKVKAQKGVTATLTPATTNENRFLPQHLTFKVAANQAGLGAATALAIKSLSLKINNNVEADQVLGAVAPADFLAKKFVIEGEVEALWQNESDFKTFTLAGTQKAVRIDIKNTDVTIGTSARPEILIDLYKVIFSELTRPVKINDLVRQTLSFKAHFDTTSGKMVQIVATNAKASY